MISEAEAMELWRHRDRKGARTFLPPRLAEAVLQEEPEDEVLGRLGVIDSPDDDEEVPSYDGPRLSMPDYFDFVEIGERVRR